MKKLAIALATLGLSCSALAAFPGATQPTEVSIPQLPGGFVFGFMGDYLQPNATNGDLDYASLNSSSPFLKSSVADIVPGYQWGFGLNVGYIFPDTGNDLNLDYSHLDTTTTGYAIPSTSTLIISPINPFFTFGTAGSAIFTINTVLDRAEYNFNQADLTVGQAINVGCRVRLHPNVGVRFGGIDRKEFVSFIGLDPATTSQPEVITSSEDSDYDGIGPIAGLDASYYLGMGFGAVAHVDSAVLIGSINSNVQPTFTGPGLVTSLDPSVQFFTLSAFSRRVVPETDAKLGLDYTYLFNNASNSNMTLEIGYQASHYYNAVNRLLASVTPTTAILTTANNITGHKTSDVGLHGAYATLIFHI